MSNAAFSSDRAEWDFILVATGFDELVDNRIDEEGRELGPFLAPHKKRAGPGSGPTCGAGEI